MNWILVTKFLPAKDQIVLTCGTDEMVKIQAYYCNFEETVTHWMPLPEAPKMKITK